MKYEVVKLNGRHAHVVEYAFSIEFSKSVNWGTGVLDFDRSRRWFNDHFGWSQDVEEQVHMRRNKCAFDDSYKPHDINPVWAYSAKYMNYRIYVASEKEVSWYILCHPKL